MLLTGLWDHVRHAAGVRLVRPLLVVLILAAAQAGGEVYTWKDVRGIDHYTNRQDDIPVRYRDRAKTMQYDREPHAAAPPSGGRETLRPARPERGVPREGEPGGGGQVRQRRPPRVRE